MRSIEARIHQSGSSSCRIMRERSVSIVSRGLSVVKSLTPSLVQAVAIPTFEETIQLCR